MNSENMKRKRLQHRAQDARAGFRSIWSAEPRESSSFGRLSNVVIVGVWLGIIIGLCFVDQTFVAVFSATVGIFLGLGFIATRLTRNGH